MKNLLILLPYLLVFGLSEQCFSDDGIYLPNLPGYATGTTTAGKNGLDVNITSPISVLNPAEGLTGAAVPTYGSYTAGNKAGNLTGMLIGQQTMANSLACVLPSDQSAIPVSQSGVWTVTASNPSVGALSFAIPASATMVGYKDGSGNLQALQSGQQLMASSIPVVLASNQSSLGVTGTFWQATQPISAASLPLPSGASTDAELAIINTTLGSPFQAGGSIGNASFGISGTLPAFAATPTVNLGTIGGAATAALQTTGNTSLASVVTNTANIPAKGQATMANSMPVVIASDQTAIPISGSITATAAANTNGSFVLNASLTTVVTESPPANAVGFILEASSANNVNIRWALGAVATTTSGMRLEPGRDTGYVPVSKAISIVSESGANEYQLTWVKSL